MSKHKALFKDLKIIKIAEKWIQVIHLVSKHITHNFCDSFKINFCINSYMYISLCTDVRIFQSNDLQYPEEF